MCFCFCRWNDTRHEGGKVDWLDWPCHPPLQGSLQSVLNILSTNLNVEICSAILPFLHCYLRMLIRLRNPNILESFNQLWIGSKDCPRSKQLLEIEEKSNLTMIWNSEQYVMIRFLTILSKLYTSKTPWPKAASSQFYIVYLCAFYGSTKECYKHTIYMYVYCMFSPTHCLLDV